MTTPTQAPVAAVSSARAVQVAISAQAMRDVTRLWPLLNGARLNETFPAWLRAMITLVRSYHQQSAVAAASFYREVRAEATRSHAPSSLIRMAASPTDEWLTEAFGYSGPGLLNRDLVRPNTALSTTLGTASRIVLDGARSTVGLTVEDDPVAVGWYLLTDADPCSWCAMIASRGVVYKQHSLSRSDAKFIGKGTAKLHNHCHCVLAPAFSHDQPLPLINREAAEVYANRGDGPALQAFRKAWDSRTRAS